jgi:integrase
MATITKGRPHKDGSIPWVVRYVDHDGIDHIKTFDRLRKAKDYKLEIEQQVRDGHHTPEWGSGTVAEACEAWLRRCEHVKKLRRITMRNYSDVVRRNIVPLIGDKKLAKLTISGVESFMDDLTKSRKPGAAIQARWVLGAVIKLAMRDGKVRQNVARETEVPQGSRKRTHEIGDKTPTAEEVNLLLDNAHGRFRMMILTMALTGLRSGEARGLEWDWIDFDTGMLRVRQAADFWSNVGDPKTDKARRDIPTPDELRRELKEWRLVCPRAGGLKGLGTTEAKALQIEQLLNAGLNKDQIPKRLRVTPNAVYAVRKAMPLTPTGRLKSVFPNYRGGVLNAGTFYRELEGLQLKLGIVTADGKAKYSPHSLRHFYASWLREHGAKPEEVQLLLGHSLISTTMGTYVHLFKNAEAMREMVNTAAQALRGTRIRQK